MTDRELLEAAARAAGYFPYDFTDEEQRERAKLGPDHAVAMSLRYPYKAFWHPLLDDGDAFRLAVTLKIKIDYVGDQVTADGLMAPGMTAEESARRAIVRAAAAMAGEK